MSKLTKEDKELLDAIMVDDIPEKIAARIFNYYHHGDRADRTPRNQMYLHMGMLCGAIMKMVARSRESITITTAEEKADA